MRVDEEGQAEEVASTTDAESADVNVATENVSEAGVASTSVEEAAVELDVETEQSAEAVVPEAVVAETGTTTALQESTGTFGLVFARVTEWFNLVQAGTSSAVSTEPVASSTQNESEVVVETEPVAVESVADVVATSSGEVSVESTDAEAVEVATSTDMVATTTDEIEIVEEVAEEFVGETTTNENGAGETTSSTEAAVAACDNDCEPYRMVLSGFSVPLDETQRLAGAQLRMSMGVKRKSTRDEIQSLQVRYSFDDGETWGDSGQVIIDDEVSNGINGGYFLFALPQIADSDLLKDMQVALVYNHDYAELESLYIDSVWLELFMVDAPDTFEFYESLLEESGYDDSLLSGDALVLDTGETINFTNTDENNGETLIIKSDRTTYSGLTEATTYFSVTNTSDRADSFMVQTYFPKTAGTVERVRVWNQNQPAEITVPEYRPFVYHCSVPWEETSKQLTHENKLNLDTVLATSTPVQDNSGSLSTTTEDASVATPISSSSESVVVSTSSVPLGSSDSQAESVSDLELGTTTTTTTLETVATSSELLQAVIENIVASSTDDLSASTSVHYHCPATDVVRICDTLDGDGTSCRVENVKVQDHTVTRYTGGWDDVKTTVGAPVIDRNVAERITDWLGFGPDTKTVPNRFALTNHTEETYDIAPGETVYFEMDISFPPHSNGEYWVEAIGAREYGLLDPFWSSQWQYRLPIIIDNTDGVTDLTEFQVFMQLDDTLSDFWSNINADGSDIRFVQEVSQNNIFSETGPTFDNAYNQDWSSRIALTIAADNIDTSLTNYPVYVNLADLGSSFWSGVQSDGRDIRVTSADGATELPIDIVEIDVVAETGELHFLAPFVSNGTDTTFHIYFGNAGATAYTSTDTYGRNAVWAEYEAVYHFEEDPNTGITDKTGNGFDLTTTVGTAATTSGQLGTALDTTASSVVLEDTDWTWTAGDNLYSSGLYFMSSSPDTGALWQFSSTCAGDNCLAFMPQYNGSIQGYHRFGETGGNNYTYTPNNTIWHHFSTFGRADQGDLVQIYEDNVLLDTYTQTATGVDPSRTGLQIGRYNAGTYMNIDIDELRFRTSEPSLAWVAAEHLNFSTSTDFYATSTQLAGGVTQIGWYDTSWEKRLPITLGNVPETLTDYPIYVDLSTLGSTFFADVQSTGADIRITADDGVTEVPLEVVGIDTGVETGELYFKATISGGEQFFVYFDNPDAAAYPRASTYGSEQVWTNSYQAVYHFEEEASGTGNTDLYQDSTANQYHGDDDTVTPTTTGQLGQGVGFGNDVNDVVRLPNEVLDGVADHSVSWWHNTTQTSDAAIVSAANLTQSNEFLLFFPTTAQLNAYFNGPAESFGLADTVGTFNTGLWQYYMETGKMILMRLICM